MTRKGIDVSEMQGKIDWTKVKGNVSYAIIRAGYGNAIAYPNQVDKQFINNYNGCKKNGIPCGAYWYSYATTVDAMKQEAKCFIAQLKGKKFEYPVYLDLEEQSQLNLGKTICSKMVVAFCTELEKAGYWTGLYMSRSHMQAVISEDILKRYTIWVAEVDVDKPNYNGTYGMWQYSWVGRVNGISGDVDMDYCYVDYPTQIKAKGLNGYPKTNTTPTLETSGYKLGDKNTGVYGLKRLMRVGRLLGVIPSGVTEDNNFDEATQNAVNQALKKWGYAQNGIAGMMFMDRLGDAIEKKIN